jgi:hypothetical protein
MSPVSLEETSRVLIEALRQSRSSNVLDLERIALAAKASEPVARAIVAQFLTIIDDGHFSVESRSRVQLALEVARVGPLKDAAKALSWQEFESFGAECLAEAGFRVEKNVRVKGEGRAWQIDLIGYRGDLVLTIDCKHWNTSGYESRLAPPAEHQRKATSHLLRALTEKTDNQGKSVQGLAVILTLLEPPLQFLEKAAIVSVEQLPGFLTAVTPYDVSLPLISTSDLLVENPMS